MSGMTRESFLKFVQTARTAHPGRTLAVPLCIRLLSDQLTPVLAYRRLVAPDARTAPSFLLESVEGGERQGRYSILGARPIIEVVARQQQVTITDALAGSVRTERVANPLESIRKLSAGITLATAVVTRAGWLRRSRARRWWTASSPAHRRTRHAPTHATRRARPMLSLS